MFSKEFFEVLSTLNTYFKENALRLFLHLFTASLYIYEIRFSLSFTSQPTWIQQNVFEVSLEYLAHRTNWSYQKCLGVNKKKLVRKKLQRILQQKCPQNFERCSKETLTSSLFLRNEETRQFWSHLLGYIRKTAKQIWNIDKKS